MGFLAESRVTNRTLKLVPAVAVNKLETGYYEIVGDCGHRLEVIREQFVPLWQERIDSRSRHRKRCWYCKKD